MRDVMYNRISTINIAVHYIQKLLKEQNPKSSHHQEIFFSTSYSLYLYEMMGVHKTYCGDYFLMYASQIMMLYTLNLYSAVH